MNGGVLMDGRVQMNGVVRGSEAQRVASKWTVASLWTVASKWTAPARPRLSSQPPIAARAMRLACPNVGDGTGEQFPKTKHVYERQMGSFKTALRTHTDEWRLAERNDL